MAKEDLIEMMGVVNEVLRAAARGHGAGAGG